MKIRGETPEGLDAMKNHAAGWLLGLSDKHRLISLARGFRLWLDSKKALRNVLAGFVITLLLTAVSAQPHARPKVDFQALYYFAKKASVAYESSRAIRGTHSDTSRDVVRIATLPNVSVKYFIERNQTRRTQTIVVRGTVDQVSKDVNFEVQGVYDKKAGIYLHAGYRTVARAVYADLQGHLKKGLRIYLTGHSLGGSVANILAIYLQRDGYRIAGVYTFGQPKITNLQGALAYRSLPVRRVVNQNDIATMGPPQMRGKGGPFAHMGEEVVLLNGPYFSYLPETKARDNSVHAFRKFKTVSSATDHAMARYLKGLREKLSASKLVAYAQRQDFVVRVKRGAQGQGQSAKKKYNFSSGKQ